MPGNSVNLFAGHYTSTLLLRGRRNVLYSVGTGCRARPTASTGAPRLGIRTVPYFCIVEFNNLLPMRLVMKQLKKATYKGRQRNHRPPARRRQ